MTHARRWTTHALGLVDELLDTQLPAIEQASQWCAEAIAADGLVHLFGSGHSRIPVEEMFPRYGSYPGFNPLVELSTTFHTQIVGNNGQRQAMFIERVPGLAEVILNNFDFSPDDVYLGFSVSGSSPVPVEMVRGARARGLRTVAVTASDGEGTMAADADLVIRLPIPDGDALVDVAGFENRVGPVSSFLYVLIVNEIKVQTAALLGERGIQLPVLTGAAQVGADRSAALFDEAYSEHARRYARSLRTTPATGARSGVRGSDTTEP